MPIFANRASFLKFLDFSQYYAGHIYCDNGDFFVEECVADIKLNLVSWSVYQNTIFFLTEKFIYSCTLHTEGELANVITITQIEKSWEEVSGYFGKVTWMNKHSCSFGKEWLQKWSEYRVALY